MDARELLICNAPKEIPEWFKPKMNKSLPNVGIEYKIICDSGKKGNAYYRSVFEASRLFGEELFSFVEPPDDKELADAIKKNAVRLKKEREYWDEYAKERLLQWPAAYADMVLERSK